MVTSSCFAVALLSSACWTSYQPGDADDAAFDDAAIGGDASRRDGGISNRDGSSGPCTFDGWPAMDVMNGRPELDGCGCPGLDLVASFEPPAENASDGNVALCGPYLDVGGWGDLCAEGYVSYGDIDYAAEHAGVTFTAQCLDPALCLYGEAQLPEELRSHCIYADMTIAVTGEVATIPATECEGLRAEGLCGRGCGCTDDGQQCWGYSEANPIGTCVFEGPCFIPGDLLCPDGYTCVMATNRPSWFDLSAIAYPLGEDGSTAAGRCAPTAACEALVERVPGVWSCVDP